MQDVKVGIYDSKNTSSHAFLSSESLSHNGGKGGCAGRNPYFSKFVLLVFITSCVVILFSWTISKTRQERIRMLETKKLL